MAKLPIISKDPPEQKEEIRKVLQSRKNAEVINSSKAVDD